MALAVYTTDGSIAVRDDDSSMVIGEIGYPVGFEGIGAGRLPLLGVREEIGFQGLGVDKIASLAIDGYPQVLLLIDEYLVYATRDAELLFEPVLRFTVKLLLFILVDTITHISMNPQVTLNILLDFIHRVIGKGGSTDIIVQEHLDTESVIAGKSCLCTKPHISLVVLEDGIDMTVDQSVPVGETVELNILIRSPCCRGNQTEGQNVKYS